ncbi:hypothetical protein BGW39_000134 [Mortierella sp. 14UC]|nr:hypothetical protein BGW39_000134 [Mortierella sp. 14UC]
MSEHNPAFINTTATSTVLGLPELMQLIGQHLSLSDLFSGVQVCSTWNNFLIPLLWQTIDTSRKGWLRIFNVHGMKDRASREAIEQSVRLTLAKHGHHIRHLTTRWRVVLDTLSVNGECTKLCSLVVGDIKGANLGPSFTADTAGTTTAISTTTTALANVRLPWSTSESNSYDSSPAKVMRERRVIKQFWTLVLQNPGLVRLCLPSLETMKTLSKDFILDILKSLEHLRDLDLKGTRLNMWALLSSLPKLERLPVYHRDDLVSSRNTEERYTGLRSLNLVFYVQLSDVFKLLEYFPGVEELRIGGVAGLGMKEVTVKERELSLKALHVHHVAHYEDKNVALLVSQCPRLVHFRTSEVLRATRQALWETCYLLETLESVSSVYVSAWRQRRSDDARRRQEGSA